MRAAVANLVLTQLRSEIGKISLDEAFSTREKLNSVIMGDLAETCLGWGAQLTRIEIQDITPSRDIVSAMEMEMTAERRRRAAVLESEGLREAAVNEAEGMRAATVLRAKAEAEATSLRAQAEAERMRVEASGTAAALIEIALGVDGAGDAADKSAELLALQTYMQAQLALAASPNSKVMLFPTKDSVPMTAGMLKGVWAG